MPRQTYVCTVTLTCFGIEAPLRAALSRLDELEIGQLLADSSSTPQHPQLAHLEWRYDDPSHNAAARSILAAVLLAARTSICLETRSRQRSGWPSVRRCLCRMTPAPRCSCVFCGSAAAALASH